MNKFIAAILLVLTAITIVGFCYIAAEDKEAEQKFIEQMEVQQTFSQDEIDALWHFKNEHNCSEKFMQLYNKKIKPL